jgi:tetratricopeptide (TPR) repeat protein
MVSLWVLVANPGAAAPGLVDLLNQYERGEFDGVARAIVAMPPPAFRPASSLSGTPTDQFVIDMQRLAPQWIAAAGAEAAPRRRLVIASFALELAHWRRSAPGIRYPLLVWACELLRKNPTRLPGERWWYLASIALHQKANDWIHVLGADVVPVSVSRGMTRANVTFFSRADQEEFSTGHLAHARAALPGEPRLLLPPVHYAESLTFLASGIGGPHGINSQQTSPQLLESLDRLLVSRVNASRDLRHLDSTAVKLILERVDRIPGVASRYAALGEHEALRGDAELHQGFLALRLESWDEALLHLDEVARVPSARALVGLSHLFRGWIFEQTNRVGEAIAAYRLSLEAAPLARTASILLAAQLTRIGRQREAYTILDAALKASPAPDVSPFHATGMLDPAPDPWLLYQRGDAVMLATYIDRLRETLR